jgi:hypothetical protein
MENNSLLEHNWQRETSFHLTVHWQCLPGADHLQDSNHSILQPSRFHKINDYLSYGLDDCSPPPTSQNNLPAQAPE